ncbi:MFS transporter [Pseudonocardia sp. ICBG1122]|nr:MFS transporter [Pseudonocardia pini]
MTSTDAAPVADARRRARTAATSGFLGTTLEYYDFLIYGTAAALYFGPVFFPRSSYDTLLALGSIGAAYAARPFGAVVWGHLGDRIGRRRTLLAVLLTMGVATFAVGCVPGAATIGAAAPVVLVLLRVVQGISAGGEQAGSALLALEHAPDDRRAFYTSWTQSGAQLGNVLAFAVFLPLAALLPEGAMASWGWRIPFWSSALVVVLTLVVRRRLAEPEVPGGARPGGGGTAIPIAVVLRDHRPAVVRVVVASLCIAPAGLVNIFGLSYAAAVPGLGKPWMLLVVTGSSLAMIATQPLFALLADRIGRRPVFVVGALGSAAVIPLWLAAVRAGDRVGVFAGGLVLMAVFVAMTSGVLLATFLEMFPLEVRYSGMAVSFMLGIVVTGFVPAIAQSFVQGDPDGWAPIAWLFAAIMVAAAVAVATGPENHRVPTAELGRRTPAPAGGPPHNSPPGRPELPVPTTPGDPR